MPEAPAHLNDESCAYKYDVVASASLVEDRAVHPVAKATPVEFLAESQFWAGIASSLSAHPAERTG